ncbi:MAG: hypothetical protein ACFBSE_07520 [Prochloraceae cyanobacterium]
MIGAIVWELGNIYLVVSHHQIPQSLQTIYWLERPALMIHLIEGIIAAYYSTNKEKNPLIYGIYTFFVGTIGLWELLKNNKSSEVEN